MFFPCSPVFFCVFPVFSGIPRRISGIFRRFPLLLPFAVPSGGADAMRAYGRVCGAVWLRFMRQPSASLIVSPEGVKGH